MTAGGSTRETDAPSSERRVAVFLALTLLPVAYYMQETGSDIDAGILASPPAAPLFTLQEIGEFNGDRNSKSKGGNDLLYLAFWGRVFDVTSAPEFYQPGAAYGKFAGHDCTRAFALHSLKRDLLDMDMEGLEESKLISLNNTYWETYRMKYPIVGKLDDPPYDAEAYDHFAGPYSHITLTLPSAGAGPDYPTEPRQSKCPMVAIPRAAFNAIKSMLPTALLER